MSLPGGESLDMLGRSGAVPLHEALRRLHDHLHAASRSPESVPLAQALNRVLSRNLLSTEDLPPHPRSTMDGFAVRASETFGATESLPAYLEIQGEVFMGEFPGDVPSPGACFRISTGGYLPPGTDAVVMLEHTVPVDGKMIEVTQPVVPGGNVIATGEDVRKGEPVLGSGHRLRPQDIGLLAGLGITEVGVYPRVKVGILSTGDEIVPCHEQPPPGKIRDINSVHLAALCIQAGAVPAEYGIFPDSEDALMKAVRRALEDQDLVVLSGSSSVGSRDMGERVLGAFGPPGIVVHGVMVKPGKPVIVAFGQGKPLFGLPGHPVSAAVAFNLFVRPALDRLSGAAPAFLPTHRTVHARIMRNLNSAAGRRDFIRVELRNPDGAWEAHPVLGKSGAVSPMVRAHGYIIIEEPKQGLKQGEAVEVFLYE